MAAGRIGLVARRRAARRREPAGDPRRSGPGARPPGVGGTGGPASRASGRRGRSVRQALTAPGPDRRQKWFLGCVGGGCRVTGTVAWCSGRPREPRGTSPELGGWFASPPGASQARGSWRLCGESPVSGNRQVNDPKRLPQVVVSATRLCAVCTRSQLRRRARSDDSAQTASQRVRGGVGGVQSFVGVRAVDPTEALTTWRKCTCSE
jgi:hypothetical protein